MDKKPLFFFLIFMQISLPDDNFSAINQEQSSAVSTVSSDTLIPNDTINTKDSTVFEKKDHKVKKKKTSSFYKKFFTTLAITSVIASLCILYNTNSRYLAFKSDVSPLFYSNQYPIFSPLKNSHDYFARY